MSSNNILRKVTGDSCYKGSYNMNITYGCSHGCIYCYGVSILSNMRNIRHYAGGSANTGVPKDNLSSILDIQLQQIKKKPVYIRLSTMSDPFQPRLIEQGITQSLFRIFDKHEVRVYILTKGIPNEEIIYLMTKQPHKYYYTATCANISEERWKLFEPGTSSPNLRIQMAQTLKEYGVKVWVDLDPIIPGYDDTEDAMQNTLEKCRMHGIQNIMAAFLFLRTTIKGNMKKSLHPDIYRRIERFYEHGEIAYLEPEKRQGKILNPPLAYQSEKLILLDQLASAKGLSLSICRKKNGSAAIKSRIDLCSSSPLFNS